MSEIMSQNVITYLNAELALSEPKCHLLLHRDSALRNDILRQHVASRMKD